MINKQIILKERPVGFPNDSTWSLESNEIPDLNEGEVLIQHHYISLDPAMRGWMNDSKSYIAPVAIDEVMRSGSIGKVIKSNNHPSFKVGDCVTGWGGVQQFVITDGNGWFKVDDSIAPMPMFIGTLGMPGMTAYFGITEVGKIKEGDIVLVSGAAGAVGSVVGQVAKIKGCTVIGIAGGKEKCDYLLDELGFDAAIDYKSENIYEALREKCPKGVDVYFDNVGGELLETVLFLININARVLLCGGISSGYDATKLPDGPKNLFSLIINRATMQGFLVLDYLPHAEKALEEIGTWVMEGKIKHIEDVQEGLENCPQTLNRLFTGQNFGKQVLKI